MRDLARALVRRLAAAARGPAVPAVDRWRRALAHLQLGPGSRVDHLALDVRGPGCSVSVGDACDLGCTVVLERAGGRLRVGSRTSIGGGTTFSIAASVDVGDDVLVSFDVLVMDHNSHAVEFDLRRGDGPAWIRGQKDWTHVPVAPVVIRDKAWVGARAIVLRGVTVGEGAVVGAGSVVTRDVPDWTVVAGNPARVVRELPH